MFIDNFSTNSKKKVGDLLKNNINHPLTYFKKLLFH